MNRIKLLYLFPLSIILWLNWWITAIILISLLIIISLIVPKKAYNPIVQIVCKILMYISLIFPRQKGINPEDMPFPVIYVANHVSFFDLFISGSVLPGYPRGIELKQHFSLPVYGWFISRFGQIPIEVKNPSSIKKTLLFARDILEKKIRNILVMPEGGRTSDGNLKPFGFGAFYLSRLSGFPIVPVIYKGLFNRNNKTSIIISPGVFNVIILSPVDPRDFDDDNSMGIYIRNLMEKKLSE